MATNFDILDFLHVANFIVKDDAQEKNQAFLRTAIGRVYYVAYLTIRNKARLKRFNERNLPGAGGNHEKLITYLEMYVDPNIKTIFFTQSFCSKQILAKYLADKYNGLFIDSDGKITNSTKAKVEAFLLC